MGDQLPQPMLVCDAQVHAPDGPHSGPVGGISREDLLREMDIAGVDRAVIVPLMPTGSLDNEPSLAFARQDPDRFAVMGVLPLAQGPQPRELIVNWKKSPGMLGIRATFHREPNRSLLVEDQLEWLWDAAESADIPIMINAAELVAKVGEIAHRHEGLRLVLDHMGLTPFVTYSDFQTVLEPVVSLAKYPNVAVKASGLPSAVSEAYPFRSLHDPIRRVVGAFGPPRVFWGSDLTRLSCSYSDCRRFFVEELDFLSDNDKVWIMGRGVCEWLDWPLTSVEGR
jgi:L-fuconolactonase